MKSNDRTAHEIAKMNMLDMHLSYISKKINYTKEQGQCVIILKNPYNRSVSGIE